LKTLNVNLIRTEAGDHKIGINLSQSDKLSFLREDIKDSHPSEILEGIFPVNHKHSFAYHLFLYSKLRDLAFIFNRISSKQLIKYFFEHSHVLFCYSSTFCT